MFYLHTLSGPLSQHTLQQAPDQPGGFLMQIVENIGMMTNKRPNLINELSLSFQIPLMMIHLAISLNQLLNGTTCGTFYLFFPGHQERAMCCKESRFHDLSFRASSSATPRKEWSYLPRRLQSLVSDRTLGM